MNETEAQEQVDRIAPVLPAATLYDIQDDDDGWPLLGDNLLVAQATAQRNATLWSVAEWLGGIGDIAMAEADGHCAEHLWNLANELEDMLTAAKVARPEKEA